MQFGILGPLEVVTDDGLTPVPGAKCRALLADLLVNANRSLSSDQLIDDLWDGEPPPSAMTTLQTYVYQLRKAVPSLALQTRGAGYALEVAPDDVDALRFERAVAWASNGGAPPADEIAMRIDEALRWWRGPALADIAGSHWAQTESARLEELRLRAVELRVDARMTLGEHAALVGELEALVVAHPLREHLSAQLMLALYRSERQADALHAYGRLRDQLREELGIDPAPDLARLETAILQQAPELSGALPVSPVPDPDVRLDLPGVAALLGELLTEAPTDALARAVHDESDGSAGVVREIAARLREREIAERVERAVERAGAARTELNEVEELIAAHVIASPPAVATSTVATCPYKGLASFDIDDADYFFGRERLIATLVARLAASAFVTVVGPSGSGKSSLLHAGLLPALARGALPGSREWHTAALTPGRRPMEQLSRVLAGAQRPRLLVIDQFEELFTAGSDARERETFARALAAIEEDGAPRCRVVVALRADYYGHCAELPSVATAMSDRPLLVGAMSEAELRRAVLEPARRAGLRVDAELVDAIVRDTGSAAGALPLVSTALLETWARREHDSLTLEAYRDAGGVRGALARIAEDAYAALDADEQVVARDLLVRLAEPGVGSDDVRRRVPLAELARDARAGSVLDQLVGRRLVTVDDDTVEVAHEALLRHWPRLREWLADDREGRRFRQQLTQAARGWHDRGRDASDLYRGTRLDAAREWAESHAQVADAVESAFLDASIDARDRELLDQRRITRRLRLQVSALSIVLLVAVVAFGLVVVQRRRADRAADRADRAALDAQIDRLATLARTLPSDEADLALLLGVQAHELQQSRVTEGGLEAALVHTPSGLEQVLRLDSPTAAPNLSGDRSLVAVPERNGRVQLYDTTTGHLVRSIDVSSGPRLVALFSGDDRRLALGGTGGRVDVVDVASGKRLGAPLDVGGTIAYGEFDPTDSTRLFTVSARDSSIAVAAGTAEAELGVWNISDAARPTRVATFTYRFAKPNSPIAIVSPDGATVALGASGDGETILWDVATRTPVRALPGAPGVFLDGDHLVTAARDRLVESDVHTGGPVGAPMVGFTAGGAVARVSLDGARLAAVDAATGVRIFDVASRREVGAPIGHAGDIPTGFTSDGQLLTNTGSSISVWSIDGGAPPTATRLAGGQAGPVFADFVPGTSEIVTEGILDGSFRWWSSKTGRTIDAPALHDARAFAAFSPDGTLLVAPTADQTRFGVWDRATGEQLSLFGGGSGEQAGAAWIPGSATIAVWSGGDAVDLWDASDPRHPTRTRRLALPDASAADTSNAAYASFDADGSRMALVDQSLSRVAMFDLTGQRLLWQRTIVGSIYQLAISPDDRTVALVTLDAFSSHRIALWDGRTGRPQRSFTPEGAAVGVEFVRNGAALVVTGDVVDGSGSGAATTTAQLWDLDTLQPIGIGMPAGAPGSVFVARDATSMKVLIGSGTGIAALWDIDVAHWTSAACAIAGRTLTRAEWDRYLPGRPYAPACRGA